MPYYDYDRDKDGKGFVPRVDDLERLGGGLLFEERADASPGTDSIPADSSDGDDDADEGEIGPDADDDASDDGDLPDDPWDDWIPDPSEDEIPDPDETDAAPAPRGAFGRLRRRFRGGRRGQGGGWFQFVGGDRTGTSSRGGGRCRNVTITVSGRFASPPPRGSTVSVRVEGHPDDGSTSSGGDLLCEDTIEVDDDGNFWGRINCSRSAGTSDARVDVLVAAGPGADGAFAATVAAACGA